MGPQHKCLQRKGEGGLLVEEAAAHLGAAEPPPAQHITPLQPTS